MPGKKTYLVKKGPADAFRGDWYTEEETFTTAEQAIAKAAALTFVNYDELKDAWEQFGYEWSVFEQSAMGEKKIWEGFKYIKTSENKTPDVKLGLV